MKQPDVIEIAGNKIEVNANGWEVSTCSRCGGTGKYSFNLMHGSRCYGCGGAGYTMTSTGKKARQKWLDALTCTVADVVVGDYVSTGASVKWRKVRSIESDSSVRVGGVVQPRISLRFKSGTWGAEPHYTILRACGQDDKDLVPFKAAAIKWQGDTISRRKGSDPVYTVRFFVDSVRSERGTVLKVRVDQFGNAKLVEARGRWNSVLTPDPIAVDAKLAIPRRLGKKKDGSASFHGHSELPHGYALGF